MTKIFTNKNYSKIYLHAATCGSSRLVVIYFKIQPSGKVLFGVGSKAISNLKNNTACVFKKLRIQYRELSKKNFLTAVKSKIDDRDVVTYGSGLGGYGVFS
ncbi:hypothetical protein E4L95_12490 [Paracoccus liaowanqingii]|uniref:Uncharacterized protein n=1 Tax=Paracoccus liaowanqingii TaxID=2560053 RepID=A0A4Z1CGI6_9RHOB|nr:hypothetical protein [Paracoccus liaowanqingii]TGN58372.1 hypothetical protein E4L95_12490 [Paracoccus liaowanqingii]